jgi:DNA invertase Pin-like site-specific DNA recombinase
MSEPPKLRAAQYLRMSTEHQRYSLENQAEAIAAYAADRGYEVIRTYFDPGRSGLTLKARPGLQALLSDALAADREFDAVLVLDVSRWGRFQDPDQSAHYEYLCREAGVDVVYCGEPFENDGAPLTTIVKQLKRLMAAEYSRELSAKVTHARRHLAGLGFHQGGVRIFGVQRLVVDAQGQPKFVLEQGLRKAVTSDRVVLIHGPSRELAIVRRIFRRFVRDCWTMSEIADELNRDGVAPANRPAWNPKLVRRVLCNELMIGVYVFNRTRGPLRARRRLNPPQEWVRIQVMEPIVSRRMFERAAVRLSSRRREYYSRYNMLEGVQRLCQEKGRLDWGIINDCPYIPSALTYSAYFGGLRNVYRAIGYVPDWKRWGTERGHVATNDELLDLLRQAHRRLGRLSSVIIDSDRTLPSTEIYRSRFGTLSRAYELAGLPHTLSEIQRLAHQRSRACGNVAHAAEKRRKEYPPDQLLEALRQVYARDGFVSAASLKADLSLPPLKAYTRAFGSLFEAYKLAGLPSDRAEILSSANRRRRQKQGPQRLGYMPLGHPKAVRRAEGSPRAPPTT